MAVPDLEPWTMRPYELIFHGELHFVSGVDYDRRLAIISFDNAIEVSITTYLDLNPINRQNKTYKKEDVVQWKHDYHTKLDFFYGEISKRGLPEHMKKDVIVWYHDQRNNQYHESYAGVPTKEVLDGIRQAAFWIFSVLFAYADIESKLKFDISKAKPEIVLQSIPESYAAPKNITNSPLSTKPENLSALTVAALMGNWDDANEGDKEIIKRLTNGF